MKASLSSSRRLAANVMHAKHGIAVTVAGREAADQRLNERLTAQFALDVEAEDYGQRLRSARRAYFQGLRRMRDAS